MMAVKIRMRKTGVLLLTGLFCAFLFIPVFYTNAENTSGTVKNRVLNVRKEASTSSAIVCKLSKGTSVTVISETTGTDGMKWYSISVSYNGKTWKGYVRADLLNVPKAAGNTNSDTQTESSGILYVKYASVRVREKASVNSSVVSGLVKGCEVKVKETKIGDDGRQWTKVSFTKEGEKIHGYIRSDLLTGERPAGSPDSSSAASLSKDGDMLYVTASAVRVRESASDSSEIIANLLKGDVVKQKSTKTGSDGKQWTKVSFTINGTKYHGYIRSDYLGSSGTSGNSGSSSASEDEKRYVNVSAVRVRDNVSESAEIVANLLKGDQVKIKSTKTGADGKEWCKVSFTMNGSKYHGYIRSEYLSKSKPSGADGQGSSSGADSGNTSTGAKSGTVRLAVINVRQTASTSSSIVAKIRQGTKATILSESTGTDGKVWYQISCTHNGNTVKGYVRSDLLNL